TAMEGRSDHAIRLCLDYLDHVGVHWSPHPSEETILSEYQALLTLIGGRSIEDLLTLPLLTDPELTATVDVLLGMLTPAFNSDRGLVSLILCRMGNLGLQHGNCDASSLGYAFLGMVLGCSFGDYRTGFLFGKLARDLVEQRGVTRYRGRIYHTLGTHVLAWTQPIATAQASLRRGFEEMREIGDVTYVGFGYCGIITLAIGAGDPLDSVQAETEKAMAHVHALKFEMAVDIFTGDLRLVRALRGLLPDPCTLDDGGRRFVGGLTTCWYWIRTMQACFIYGDMPAALEAMTRAEPLIASSAGFFELPEYHFYAALVRAACLEQMTAAARAPHEAALADHRSQLAVWADNCPETFTNRLALVDAELARAGGRPLEAMESYERAIRSARDNGFVHNEAIAFEAAARFYAARGFETIARTYRQHARLGYLRWGANGKVRQLDELHEHTPAPLVGAAPSAIEAPSAELDLATVVKTSQAVTSEVGLEKLIETLMAIALEHAGAERGLLILPRAGELHIEAEASTDGERGVTVRLRRGVARHPELPETILHYASRTQ
ncbi:MAG TPA: histidine kinase, partial [Burkholderiaceae bacterium]|nr:histidine kinase [Burkholderiaceae bacterium]